MKSFDNSVHDFFSLIRMEKLDIRCWSSQAKSIGTIITVTGAFVVTLYKGPILLSDKTSGHPIHLNLLLSMSKQSKWIFGGLFLALGYLFMATWSVLQVMINRSPLMVIINKFLQKLRLIEFYICIFNLRHIL